MKEFINFIHYAGHVKSLKGHGSTQSDSYSRKEILEKKKEDWEII